MRNIEVTELRALAEDEPRPWLVMWDLTYACQLRCSHCYQMNLPWDRPRELPTGRVLETLDELQRLGTVELTLSGGDPWARRDFPQILAHAGTLGFQLVVFSSGMALTAEVAAELKEARVSWIELTLMGADAATHDAVTRRPGSFDRLVRGAALVRDAGVQVVAKTVVTRTNLHQIGDIIELCRSLRISHKYDPHMWRPWRGREEQVAHLKLDRRGLREFYSKYRPPEPLQPSCGHGVALCMAGRERLGITPFGKVNPCNTFGEAMVLGDLHTRTITEIWLDSPALKAFRARTSESYPRCHSCSISSFCDWCPGLSSWSGNDGIEPYDQLCQDTEVKKTLWEERTGHNWPPLPIVELSSH